MVSSDLGYLQLISGRKIAGLVSTRSLLIDFQISRVAMNQVHVQATFRANSTLPNSE